MIAALSGTILTITNNKISLLTNQSIAFELFCPQANTFSLSQSITLSVYMHWNQEQGPTLFGFLESFDKEVFLLIISCSGIGPKLGLSILEQISADQFLHLIHEENVKQLSALKNIGTKKAEQLCIHLKEKVAKLLINNQKFATKLPATVWRDLHDTLLSLHYSNLEIKQTTTLLKNEHQDLNPQFDFLLRKALQLLSKK
ncbi:hypothetical protein HYV11_03700 [Candidatus Dependentiae bacterium]|nr:hypothetical protein [Candidatus Dependentiae bacterium]